MRPIHTVLVVFAVLAAPALSQKLSERLAARVHESGSGKLPYRLFAPAGADEADTKFPLVLFLHGAGERGSDNARQLVHGVRDFVATKNQARRPCFVVAPQCPGGVWWHNGPNLEMCVEIVDALCEEHPIDTTRLYVTGLSMGGYGTWFTIARNPKRFAAAVPICGGGDPKDAETIADIPIWAFHGGADRVVKPSQSRAMIEAIEKAGGEAKYTEYEGVGHNSWARTYADTAVHEWLFAQRLATAEPLKNGDRIAFFGDSITQAGARGNGYIRLIEADLKKTDLDVELIGAGISGHKVPDLQKRIDRDVLSKKPTIVMIYIGINDVWHWNRNRGTKKEDFDSGLRHLIAQIVDSGARVILCTPSVIGEKTDGSNKFDPMLEEYSAISRKVAADTGTQLLDLRARFIEWLQENNAENADRGQLTSDSVHLNAAGNRFVADCMLQALGVR